MTTSVDSFQRGYDLIKQADAISGPEPRARALLRDAQRMRDMLPLDSKARFHKDWEVGQLMRASALRAEGERLIKEARASLVRKT